MCECQKSMSYNVIIFDIYYNRMDNSQKKLNYISVTSFWKKKP